MIPRSVTRSERGRQRGVGGVAATGREDPPPDPWVAMPRIEAIANGHRDRPRTTHGNPPRHQAVRHRCRRRRYPQESRVCRSIGTPSFHLTGSAAFVIALPADETSLPAPETVLHPVKPRAAPSIEARIIERFIIISFCREQAAPANLRTGGSCIDVEITNGSSAREKPVGLPRCRSRSDRRNAPQKDRNPDPGRCTKQLVATRSAGGPSSDHCACKFSIMDISSFMRASQHRPRCPH